MSLLESKQPRPKVLYHGTNMMAAAAIVRDRKLCADNPVDDDDIGAVVCTSSSRKVARMFAIEFERHNSRFPVGAVFIINGRALPEDVEVIPYNADTQGSEDEKEFRVIGDIPFDCVLKVALVGETRKLRSERWLERIWDEDAEVRRTFGSFASFFNAIKSLISQAG